ncbi:MAG: hypothetical protein LBP88_04445 [Treponema sp.]|jgi:hypothetical protein|nr:hypothetical protein [Treponema sp.]
MPVKLKKIKRKSPLNTALSKWYRTQETTGSVGLQEIEGRAALSLGDIQSVKLEDLGTFRITLSSEGMATPDELNARHGKGTKLVFLPRVELKRSLGDISFERAP